jgi:hypothetical protein
MGISLQSQLSSHVDESPASWIDSEVLRIRFVTASNRLRSMHMTCTYRPAHIIKVIDRLIW